MKAMLLPNRPYPTPADLGLARTCAEMIRHAYEMFEQWEKKQPSPGDFAWKKPEPPEPGLVYGEPLWALFRCAQHVPPRHARDTASVRWVNKRCPIGFLASSPERIHVVFRGTATDYEWVKINLRFLQADCDFDRFGEGRAHAGFLKYYKTVRAAVAARLAGLDPAGKQIVFTGHSLGGALSALAAHDAAGEDYDAVFLHYNFGAPRVFDAKLARYYERLPITTFRVVNIEDVVTTVPLPTVADLTYQHVGTPLSFSAQYGSIGNNHAMMNYLYALENPQAPQRA